jgi:hypothetical protein
MNQEFWVLTLPPNDTPSAEWVDGLVELETVTCPRHEEHQRPGRRLSPLTVRRTGAKKGSKQPILWTWQSECLVSDAVADMLRNSTLSGYELQPARVEQEDGRYWELLVTGWGGVARPESGVEIIQYCDACNLTVYAGFNNAAEIIDSRAWDGSDFFLVWPMPRIIFVSSRARDLLQRAGIPANYIRLVKTLPPARQLTPGLLSYWFTREKISSLQHPPTLPDGRLIG